MSAFGGIADGIADIDQTCHRDNAAGELRGFLPRCVFGSRAQDVASRLERAIRASDSARLIEGHAIRDE